MMVRRMMRPALAGAFLVFGTTAGATPAGQIVALDTVQPGEWQLREADGTMRKMCVRDAAMLFQLRNRGVACSRFVVDNSPTSATVHYTCPGAGHGRTTIAVETPRLLRIESQGIDAGAPFALELEGRRTGVCPTGS